MKHVEELGISPTPWTNVIDTDNPFKWNSVWDSRNGMILSGGYTQSVPDATLIAAAPELYEELRQEMERRYCVECKHAVWTKRGGIEIMTGCDGKGVCPKPSWKKVLDKASGKE